MFHMMYANWKQLIGDPLIPKEWPRRARIGLNGFGVVARTLLRCALDDNRGLDIVAINEPNLTPEQMVYLIQYDSTCGPFKGYVNEKITVTPGKEDANGEFCNIEVAGRYIGVFHCKNISEIPWHWLDVEYVLETTGEIRLLKEATKHLIGGRARKVLVIGDSIDIPLLMYPISCRGYQRGTSVVASGSAMAHAMATLVSLVEDSCDMSECMVTLILPVDRRQNLVDGPTKDPRNWRKGRGALQSVIPGRCPNVVQSVLQALPKLRSRIDAIVMHVPTFTGAVVDLTFRTVEPVNGISEIIEKLTRSSLLEKYNEIHIRTQPYNNRPACDSQQQNISSPSSMVDTMRQDSDQSTSLSSALSLGTKTETLPPIRMPADLTSIVVPMNKEDAYVSTDAAGKHTLCLLAVDCCLGIPSGNTIKLVAWFDTGVSYCERILDTINYMRSVDYT